MWSGHERAMIVLRSPKGRLERPSLTLDSFWSETSPNSWVLSDGLPG